MSDDAHGQDGRRLRWLLDEELSMVQADRRLLGAAAAVPGRRAVRPMRAWWLVTGVAAVVVAAAVPLLRSTESRPEVVRAPAVVALIATQLVTFHGRQPEGYVLDKVPAGWVVSSSTPLALVLTPQGVPDPDPTSFENKIVVQLQADAHDPQGRAVDVGGAPGVLVQGQPDGATLYLAQPDGVQLTIQVWEGLGWDAERIVEFAAGVHVTNDAQPAYG